MNGDTGPAQPGRLKWWREVVYVLAFYGIYTLIRNEGVATSSAKRALAHAKDVIGIEKALGLFHEQSIQQLFLGQRWFISFWNVFYGTAHFAVTITALVLLFRRAPDRYPLWRTTLAATTALALIGFAFYPLMPPRLLDDCGRFGGCVQYGFVDTLKTVGGLWSFDSGAMAKISNQYAAMPSLHFGWSSWCTLVLLPMVRRRWLRLVVIAYPFVTLFAIIVTANHYWLDAVGGAVVLGAGFLIAQALTAGGRRTEDKTPAAVA